MWMYAHLADVDAMISRHYVNPSLWHRTSWGWNWAHTQLEEEEISKLGDPLYGS